MFSTEHEIKAISHCSRAVMVKKCTNKVCTCKVFFPNQNIFLFDIFVVVAVKTA